MDSARAATVPEETLALVVLLRHGARSPAEYANLIDEAGSASAILEVEHGLLGSQLLEAAAGEIAGWTEDGIRVLSLLEPDYPDNLRAVHDRPPLLFLAGRLEPRDVRAVAVIGSRRASPAGLERAGDLADKLAAAGYSVVSGLAAGVDTAAHTAALKRDGRTIAVIGTGLRHFYPPENRRLQSRIAAEGAVLSQFWPDDGPAARNFPMRNAVMSGLALATVIVEAGSRSGSRVQARLALAQGRPVLLDASLLDQAWADELGARRGVHVIASSVQALELLGRLASAGPLVA
jgi:DNA processing protein